MAQQLITSAVKQLAVTTLLFIALLYTQNAQAQRKEVGSWKLTQHTSTADSITIKGTVLTKSVMGWKKVKEAVHVQVYSGKLLIASDLFLDTPGNFNLRVSIKNIETTTLRLTFRTEHFALMEIKELLPKDSELEIYTEKVAFRERRGNPVRDY